MNEAIELFRLLNELAFEIFGAIATLSLVLFLTFSGKKRRDYTRTQKTAAIFLNVGVVCLLIRWLLVGIKSVAEHLVIHWN
jgi:hypothetical protein